jgi:hypothetical protein
MVLHKSISTGEGSCYTIPDKICIIPTFQLSLLFRKVYRFKLVLQFTGYRDE